MSRMKIGRTVAFALIIYALLMFVFFSRTAGMVQAGYPAPWLRMSDGSYEILANGFVVDTLIWLTVSIIISAVIHTVKK